jgi:hypothetical protein
MKYIKDFSIFEAKREPSDAVIEIVDFLKKEYGVKVDDKFDIYNLKLIKKALLMFDKSYIKNKISEIACRDLSTVHGGWNSTQNTITLNPSIFKFKRKIKWDRGEISYPLFIIVHEIGHCIDHLERGSFSREWKNISGWKKLDRRANVPEGYDRFEERRTGRAYQKTTGSRLSDWIYKEDANFCRKYSSKNPREDFTDSLAFGVFGIWDKFKGDGGEKKMEFIKKIIKKIV